MYTHIAMYVTKLYISCIILSWYEIIYVICGDLIL